MYTISKIAEQMGISKQAVRARANARNITPVGTGKKKSQLYSLNQVVKMFEDSDDVTGTFLIDGHNLSLVAAKDHSIGLLRRLENQIDAGDMIPILSVTRSLAAYRESLYCGIVQLFERWERQNLMASSNSMMDHHDEWLHGFKFYLDAMLDQVIIIGLLQTDGFMKYVERLVDNVSGMKKVMAQNPNHNEDERIKQWVLS